MVHGTRYNLATLIFLTTLYNIMTIPHPIWFAALALIGIPIASWLGARAARGGTSPPAGV